MVVATAVVPGTLQLFVKRSRAVRCKTKHPRATLTKGGNKWPQEFQSTGGRGPSASSHKSCVLLVFMGEKVGEPKGDLSACDRHENRRIPLGWQVFAGKESECVLRAVAEAGRVCSFPSQLSARV